MKKILWALIVCFAFAGTVFAAPVDLNTATQRELETLKGVGPAKAHAIIDYRAKHGVFKQVSDLEAVRGFGKKSVVKLHAQVTVGGAGGKINGHPVHAKK
ncbi:MAG TPA: competence protein ComE [Betaproteobacteria bacterium]|nr:competence protein ComE [Betaproteobacteria bacterium]